MKINLLKPAFYLMNRLSFPKKLLLLAIINIPIILILSGTLYFQLNKTLIASEIKLEGIQQITQISELIQLAQKYRGLSLSVLTGESLLMDDYNKILQTTEEKFYTIWDNIPNNVKLYSPNNKNNIHNLNTINLLWESIKNQHNHYSLEENFKQHSLFIKKLLLLSQALANHYQLTLQNKPFDLYLTDASINTIPKLTEIIGQLRGIILGSLQKNNVSDTLNITLIRLEYQLEQSFIDLEAGIIRSSYDSPKLSNEMGITLQVILKAKNNILQRVNTLLKDKKSINPKVFYIETSKDIDSIYQLLYEYYLHNLESNIENRIDQDSNTLRLIMSISITLCLISLYFMFGLCCSTSKNIQQVIEILSDYTQGNLQRKIHLNTRDEIYSIGQAINFMGEKLNQLMIENRQEKERFEQLFENGGYATAILDNGVFIECNKKAIQVMELSSKKDFLLKSLSDLSPTIQADGYLSIEKEQQLIQQCSQEGSVKFTWSFNRENNTTPLLVDVYLTPIQYQGKTMLHAIWRDITQQTEMSEQLKEQKNEIIFHKDALDKHAIVSITDAKGLITYTNDKFSKISQYTQQELIGNNHAILNSAYHSKQFFKNMWDTISQGTVWQGQIKNRAKDGSFYWVESTIVPEMDSQGKPKQYIAIRTDITDIKALELKQIEINNLLIAQQHITEQEKQKAEQASQAKSDFLSSMSHELRTPLNAILGFGHLLETDEDEPLTEEQQSNLKFMTSGGEHLLELINDMLELSSIEAGKLELLIQPLQFTNLIQDIISLMQPIAAKESISLYIKSDDDLIVNADYDRLKKVLINLISNAIKYNQTKGSVSISWTKTLQHKIRVNIIDTGIGISTENQANIFTLFNRTGQENSTIKGTGIGLTVSKDLIELMQGEIGVNSIEQQGSTFWFELPLCSEEKDSGSFIEMEY